MIFSSNAITAVIFLSPAFHGLHNNSVYCSFPCVAFSSEDLTLYPVL
jgi:hypothetical protein